MAEIREVAAPNSVTEPQHVMSSEGAARLASLTPEQQTGGTVEDLRPPAAPEDKPAAEDKPAERVTPPAPIASIAPLEGISEKYQGIAAEYQADLAAIADEHPSLPPGELSTLFHFIGSRAAAEMARDESDASFSTGQQLGPNLANPEECRNRLLTAYGDMASAVMSARNCWSARFARACGKLAHIPTSPR